MSESQDIISSSTGDAMQPQSRRSLRKLLTRQRRIVLMLVMISSFFFVEVAVGYISNSLALVADAFHMFSDIVALIVALVAIRVAKRSSSSANTYGWQRAELLGALVNSVTLLTMCVTITLDTTERFTNPDYEVKK